MKEFKMDFYSPTNLKSYNLDESMRYQLSIDSIRDYVEVFEYIENAQSSISKEAKNSDPI